MLCDDRGDDSRKSDPPGKSGGAGFRLGVRPGTAPRREVEELEPPRVDPLGAGAGAVAGDGVGVLERVSVAERALSIEAAEPVRFDCVGPPRSVPDSRADRWSRSRYSR